VVNFDTNDRLVRWRLYVYNNRRHGREIWLAWQTARGLVLAEQSVRVDGELFCEEVAERIGAWASTFRQSVGWTEWTDNQIRASLEMAVSV
jgi:hypothetical protein